MSSDLKFLSLFWTFPFVSERPSLVWYWTRIHSAWQRWSSSWLAKGWVPWATATLLLCCWHWKCVWTWRGWSSLSCLPVCGCQNCRNKCWSYAGSGENWVTFTVIISNREQPTFSRRRPVLVSSPKDVCGTSAEISYWWRVTTQIWIVLLIGWSKFPTPRDQDLGSDTSSVSNPQMLFTRKSVMVSPSVSCFLRLVMRHIRDTIQLACFSRTCKENVYICWSRLVFFVSVGIPSWSVWRYWYGRPLVDIKVYIASCCWRLWSQSYFWPQTYPRGLEWRWRPHKLQVNKKWGHVCILEKPLPREVTLQL